MQILLLILLLVFIAYAVLIVYYTVSWHSIPLFPPGGGQGAAAGKMTGEDLTVSVIIPARNEELRIAPLLDALMKQDYPAHLLQVIVVDDQSTDHTTGVVMRYPAVQLMRFTEQGLNSYKKKCLETGIAASNGMFIITTDADCLPHPAWISTLMAFRRLNDSVMLAAPVKIAAGRSFLQVFQAIDFLVLQGITAASVHRRLHSMANGANLGYLRTVFDEVGGFSGIDGIASGDDMLLMHKIRQRYPGRVDYVKAPEAIVLTEPQLSWRGFLQQRIRWASKATHYQDRSLLPVLLLVYLANLLFAALFIIALHDHRYAWWLLAAWVAKTLVELPFVIAVSAFFNQRYAAWLLFFFQPFHIVYTLVSGLFGQLGSYEWKGRRVR